MVKGPGLFSDIGKRARDILYKDYQSDQKFTITTFTTSGVAITSTGTKKGDILLANVNSLFEHKNITTHVHVDSSSNLIVSVTVDELAPALKTILRVIRLPLYNRTSAYVELQYLHEYAGVSSSIYLEAKPVVNFSGVFGNSNVAIGTDVAFDTASGKFTRYNAGLSFIYADLIASLNLDEKGDTLRASYYHTINPLTNTAVGAELSHSFSSNKKTFTIGTQHAVYPLTLVKVRVNNSGKTSALLKYVWRPKSFFTISAEVDAKALEKSANIGLALSFNP